MTMRAVRRADLPELTKTLLDHGRGIARQVSPAHRRWRRLLHSLTLDPDALPRPVPGPDGPSFMICGSPRSGTALLTAALFQPPEVITVMEPWDGMRLPPRELFDSLRSEILDGALHRGRLDLDGLVNHRAVRWQREGVRLHEISAVPGFILGVKWPAFWRYLELLPDTKFLVCLRDPVEVVRSYRRSGGRLATGLDYKIPFNRGMNKYLEAQTGDLALRRVMLYDYIHERIIPHLQSENVHVVRYEQWFRGPETLVNEVGEFLGVTLHLPAIQITGADRADAPTDEAAFIRQHCGTAHALGYDGHG